MAFVTRSKRQARRGSWPQLHSLIPVFKDPGPPQQVSFMIGSNVVQGERSMNKTLFVGLYTLILASCAKQDGAPARDNPQLQEGNPPVKKEYPTAKEADLKGIARTRFDSPNPTAAQLARRTKNNKTIREMGLPVLEALPVVEDEQTVKLRSPEEIATRCLATTFCAIKGETKDQMLVDSLIKDYSAVAYFSPEEQRFLKSVNPSQQNLIDFSWRYECVHVFLWAMGARNTLSPPNEICPVSDDMKLIKKAGPAKFVAESKRRTAQEILDMADYYYRLHWAAIELRIKDKQSELLDEGVIRERHRALNWIIGYLNQEWDNVTTDT
jgi:hypothetical protein